MVDDFIAAAGPAPAPGPEARWRQVALLATSSAIDESPRAAAGLAAALHALDFPLAAARVADRAAGDEPWARWWVTVAAGQLRADGALAATLAAARAHAPEGPDAREVARRLDDLEAEVAELSRAIDENESEPVAAGSARFALLGHRARPERRVLVGGRSSAAYLLAPGWESLRLIRLAPSDGPSAGNCAHHTLAEIIAAVRRGESGAGRPVPDDRPAEPDPRALLDALREDPAARDRRLLALADEVRQEREALLAERLDLARERESLRAEAATRRRTRPRPAPTRPEPSLEVPVALPRTRDQAAALLGIEADAEPAEVDRAYREQVSRCHPDRVAGLHPAIRGQAEGLTVALNVARGLLAGEGRVRVAEGARARG